MNRFTWLFLFSEISLQYFIALLFTCF